MTSFPWLRRSLVPQSFLTALALVAALGGCARDFHPIRDNAEPFDQANGECVYRAQAASAAITDPAYAIAIQRRVYDACMRGRGWAPA